MLGLHTLRPTRVLASDSYTSKPLHADHMTYNIYSLYEGLNTFHIQMKLNYHHPIHMLKISRYL
jgi:hypothetical protein